MIDRTWRTRDREGGQGLVAARRGRDEAGEGAWLRARERGAGGREGERDDNRKSTRARYR